MPLIHRANVQSSEEHAGISLMLKNGRGLRVTLRWMCRGSWLKLLCARVIHVSVGLSKKLTSHALKKTSFLDVEG